MTYRPDHDRTYWRSVPDLRLVEEAEYSNDELTIALGERLDDLLADWDREKADDQRRDYLATIAGLKAELADAERRIADLLQSIGEGDE